MSENTPTKPVQKRGRKPEAHDPSDFCRVCKVNLKLNSIYFSCENLSKSRKAGAGNLRLSKIITGTLELCLSSEPYLSSRVWWKCTLMLQNGWNSSAKTSAYHRRILSKQSKAARNTTRNMTRIPRKSSWIGNRKRDGKGKAMLSRNRKIDEKLCKGEQSNHCYLVTRIWNMKFLPLKSFTRW